MMWVLLCVGVVVAAYVSVRPTAGRTAEELVSAVLAGRPAPWERLERLSDPRAQAEACWITHKRLDWEETGPEVAAEALRRAARLDPELYLAELLRGARTRDDRALALEIGDALLRRRPGDDGLRAALADLLVQDDRPDEALALLDRGGQLAPTLRLARGRVLTVSGREREAIQLLDALIDELRTSFHPDAAALRESAGAVADSARAELLGPEAQVIAAGRQGRLAPNSGVNYRLLGESLMASSRRIAIGLTLRTPDEDEAVGRRLLAAVADDPRGLCAAGLALLRRGRFPEARARFTAALERDSSWFPAALGVGAALTLAESRAWALAQRLEPGPLPPGAAALLPDLGALTPEEIAVVRASIEPLRAALPVLAERGVKMRILPLDARPTDLRELAGLEGARADDHRAIAGLGGLATPELGLSRIEDLLDTSSENGWVFAHEVAHLAFFHLPEAWRARVTALRVRAAEVGWASTQYALTNDDEFFAVTYVDWLSWVHDRPHRSERDDQGIVDRSRAMFDELARMAGV